MRETTLRTVYVASGFYVFEHGIVVIQDVDNAPVATLLSGKDAKCLRQLNAALETHGFQWLIFEGYTISDNSVFDTLELAVEKASKLLNKRISTARDDLKSYEMIRNEMIEIMQRKQIN